MAVFERGYALIVGVGADLPNTVADADGLAQILRDPGRCAYPPDHVRLLTADRATGKNILAALDDLARSSDERSTIVIYFSGHGYRVVSSTGEFYYLLPYGYDLDQLYKTAISGAEFADRLRAIRAQKLLVLLDCCHAGGVGEAKAPGLQLAKAPLPPEAQSLLAEGSGRVVIASSRQDELSYAGRPYSAFTLALIEALSGAGVAEKDGYVRVTDLALHAREMVPGRTGGRQHPILHLKQADNFALAYYAGGDAQPKDVPFTGEPEIEPQPGAWRLDQRGQSVHGPQVNVAGDASGQMAFGNGNLLFQAGDISGGSVTVGLGTTDQPVLGQLVADLKAQVVALAPPERVAAALERVEELEQAILSQEPDRTTMEYVRHWFARNLPDLAEAVTRVVESRD